MSPSLQVRNVPEDIHAELRRRAEMFGMSLSDYVLQLLTEVASRPTVAEVLQRSAERGDPPGITGQDVVDIIRRGRDAR
ncbi:hypothetical protein EFK50_05325 [Nocardioides marmoriginsengisoli]|uniref:Antitoxin FitA-like ribbon-helix-helix domain-containing protein n=1 Tax=Nocardioides marmoriginsengisoli TaxID=661483 RepID=A0A3N0CQ82_9ACTN|nr:hypothetical protein [Nocardioides marmoriginsengisoli]RNL65530.1 hypothetical protein EFK50_05325 [Nocardioides marmoriginsengisoli]